MDASVACARESLQILESQSYQIDPLSDPRWAALVDRDPRSSLFHSPKWLGALRLVHGYVPVALTTSPPGSHLRNGLVFCEINSWLTGRRLVSLPFSDHCEPLAESADESDELLLHLSRRVDEEKFKYLEVRPVCYRPSDRTGLSRGVKYILHRLDLRPSLEKLFSDFHKDCIQRKIRRSEREGLRYEESISDDALRAFYRLLVLTRRRQQLPPQPLSWFRGLIANFGKDLKIRTASKNGEAVASILTLFHKKSVVYKYGCSDAQFNRLGGMALLFWKTIQDAKEHGFEELDMGRSEVENQGLITFKGHLGATSTEIDYWSHPTEPPGLSSAWKRRWVQRVSSNVPDRVLVTIGRLMYKHIG